jgi:transcription initiation factor TFIIIB Brf1 subunit/transcription initiation factor TFIIB
MAEERGVTTGVHPAGFAVICLHRAGREEKRWLTQTEVTEAVNILTATSRNHHDVLQQIDTKLKVRSTAAEEQNPPTKGSGYVRVVAEDIDNGRGSGVDQKSNEPNEYANDSSRRK